MPEKTFRQIYAHFDRHQQYQYHPDDMRISWLSRPQKQREFR